MKKNKVFKMASELGISAAVIATLAVAGCGGGSSSSGGGGAGTGGTALTIQGNGPTRFSLAGTWISCHGTTRDELIVSGTSLLRHTYTGTAAATAGSSAVVPACAGGTLDPASESVLTTGAQTSTIDVTGPAGAPFWGTIPWIDGMGAVTPYPGVSVGDPLTANAFPVTGTHAGAAYSGKLLYWIDITGGAVNALYRSRDFAGGCPTADVAGVPQCLSSVDPYYK